MKKMLIGVLEGFMSYVSSHRRTMGTLVCFLMLTVLPQTLQAATVVFDNQSAFLAATGATSATGALPNLGCHLESVGGGETVGSATFTLGGDPQTTFNLCIGAMGVQGLKQSGDWTLLISGHDIAISGPENLNIDFTTDVFSVGFPYAKESTDHDGIPITEVSEFTVTLIDRAGTIVDAVKFPSRPDDVLRFFGMRSSTPFARIEIRETSGGIKDDYFGEVFTSLEEPDSDGDGVPNDEDECPNSDLSATVVIDGCNSGVPNTLFPSGCTISDLMAACAEGASNHGQFIRCVSRLTNDLRGVGTITGQQRGAIQRCAAQAHIP